MLKRFLFKKILFFILIVFISSFLLPQASFSKTIDEEISEISQKISDLEKAIAPLKQETGSLSQKIKNAKNSIYLIGQKIDDLGEDLVEAESDLQVQQTLLEERIKNLYKNNKKFNPLLIFLSSTQNSDLMRQLSWYQSIINQDMKLITNLSSQIITLQTNKKNLNAQKDNLAVLKKDLETRFGFLNSEIKKAEDYKAILNQKQKELISQKLASLNLPTSLGGGPLSCVDDRQIDPGFGTGFAFFTFGIPHHVGLNQYGAYGRAKAGQNYKEILNAYYNNVSIEKKPNINISVRGYGSMSLEQYLLGIYEVPGSWPLEALKAQVIAARSYAVSYTNNGTKEICTTQACQVYKGGNKGGDWEKAVRETEGEQLIQNGQAITAWYASTAGGYTYTSSDIGWKNTGWTKRTRDVSGDINSFEDLFNKAYDKDSPCFYSAQGYRTQYNKSAWLKPEEVADVVNSILLSQKDNSVNSNLLPPDQGGWSMDQVRQELRSRGVTPYTSISSVSISWDKGSGQTTQVSLSGDAGSANLDGPTFKNYFNSRAPANIAIVGPLFNVEKR